MPEEPVARFPYRASVLSITARLLFGAIFVTGACLLIYECGWLHTPIRSRRIVYGWQWGIIEGFIFFVIGIPMLRAGLRLLSNRLREAREIIVYRAEIWIPAPDSDTIMTVAFADIAAVELEYVKHALFWESQAIVISHGSEGTRVPISMLPRGAYATLATLLDQGRAAANAASASSSTTPSGQPAPR